jgi:sialate O-acetylesterase
MISGNTKYIADKLMAFTVRALVILIFTLTSQILFSQISLPKVFGDHMVMQREIPIPVWGNAEKGTQITVELGKNRITTQTNEDGEWMVYLPEMQAGGPYTLNVYNQNDSVYSCRFQDIMIGDVWVASGQSNMEWQVQQSMNAEKEMSDANHSNIRLFQVEHSVKVKPQSDVKVGSWAVCDSSIVKDFSAVGYFFGRDLYNELNIPIGIIQSTWGGTPVHGWTSREQLLSTSLTYEKVLDGDTITEDHFKQDELAWEEFWDIVYNPKNNTDKTIPDSDYNDSKWQKLEMPSTYRNWGWTDYEGMVWFRKTIKIPEEMAGKDLQIHLGLPEMNYSVYFNGTEICKTIWNANPQHNYIIPAKDVRKGDNVIAARLAILWGGGGFNPPADSMFITDGLTKIPMAGKWSFKRDVEPQIPEIVNYHKSPSFLFNGMIAPLIPYGIKGFIWYQGEEDVKIAKDYQTLFPLMISDWRIRWQQGYIPFLFVQLANFMEQKSEPTDTDWARLREAQSMALSQPNTGMITAIDIGEADDIHPINKQEVGKRLALLAGKMVYDKDVQAAGPFFKSYEIDNDKIIITFSETGLGLATKDGTTVKGFAIAGRNKKFYWADAKIYGNKVIVSSKKVKNPVAVRYAWADNPECNLVNKEGFPAFPFRTDNWKLEKDD